MLTGGGGPCSAEGRKVSSAVHRFWRRPTVARATAARPPCRAGAGARTLRCVESNTRAAMPASEEGEGMSNDHFARLPQVPSFTVTSRNISEGGELPRYMYSGSFGVPGGEDRSPALSWSGAPEGTQSYAVTMYDPDAPTGSGFWHWAVFNIPASVTELAEGAGDEKGSGLPDGAVQLRNDGGAVGFIGAAPPAGHGTHRYIFVVHALDVPALEVPKDASPAFLGFNIFSHILGRAVITTTGEIPA